MNAKLRELSPTTSRGRFYQRAGEGKAPTVPGIGQPYEAPSNPEIVLDTTKYSPIESARKVLKRIPDGKVVEEGRRAGSSHGF